MSLNKVIMIGNLVEEPEIRESSNKRRYWTIYEEDILRRLISEDFSHEDIALVLGRSHIAVKVKALKMGVTRGTRIHRAVTREKISLKAKERFSDPANHHYPKGGRRLNHNGYIEILRPDHHRARGNGYVFEHIIVAEQKYGRQIMRAEDVHHINHDKTDNRPENLIVMAHDAHPKEHTRILTGSYKMCRECGTSFYVKPSQLGKRIYCSTHCAGKNSELVRRQEGRRLPC